MTKTDDIRTRFGGNLAESMGANRTARPGGAFAPAKADPLEGTERFSAARMIEVSRIEPDPNQPRKTFKPGEIDALAASLEEHGQLQPILVRPGAEAGRFIIVSGERRHRASVQAGRRTIAAVVSEEDDPGRTFIKQLVENCLRADLGPLEQARAFRTALDRNGWSALRLGESLKMSESTILKSIAMLELPEAVQELVESGKLSPAAAYEIKKADPADHQVLAERAVAQRLTREETIELARASRPGKPVGQGRAARPRAKAKGGATHIRPATLKRLSTRMLAADPSKARDMVKLADELEAAAAEIRESLAKAG